MATLRQAAADTRQVTICNKWFPRQRGRSYVRFPVISLSGKWLKQQGFKAGQVIDIACKEGELVITVAKEQRYDV